MTKTWEVKPSHNHGRYYLKFGDLYCAEIEIPSAFRFHMRPKDMNEFCYKLEDVINRIERFKS